MRIPTLYAAGDGLSGLDGSGEAAVALAHSARALREFASSIDAFDEAAFCVAEAADCERKAIVFAQATADAHGKFYLPDDFHFPVRYWRERQVLHAKTGVIALHQVREGLRDFQRITRLPAALTAIEQIDNAVPDLVELRDAVAHANARSAWRANRTFQPVRARSEGSIYYSDLASSIGHVEGFRLFLRISRDGNGHTASIAISDGTLDAVLQALQELVNILPWDRSHGQMRPVYEPFMNLQK